MHAGRFINRSILFSCFVIFPLLSRKRPYPNPTALLRARIYLGWVFVITSVPSLPELREISPIVMWQRIRPQNL
jgi:hypothetical protein